MWISCGKAVESVQNPAVFHMNLSESLDGLDPAFASSRSPLWMTAQIFNGLVELDEALSVKPAIAHSWEISDGGLTYTFHLRPDIYFHKHALFGADSTRRVIASDFVYSFSRICDRALASSGFWIFNGKIEGLDAWRRGEASAITGFQAPDDSTLVIRLLQPFPPFLSLLAMPYGYVLPQEAVDYFGDRFRANPIGTGPFRFFRWKEGQRLILHKNPNYFEREKGERLPLLDAVSVSFINSRLSAFIEFTQGKLDFIGDLDNSYKDEILSLDGEIKEPYKSQYTFLLAPQLNTEYLAFQVDDKLEITQGHPLSDVQIRKALNYAIDREKLVKYMLNGMGYPAQSGFVPYGMPGFDAEKVPGYHYDPDEAARLLAEAGYPNGAGLPPITLYSTQKYAHISEFVQKSLEQLGVQLIVQNLEGGSLRTESKNSRINFWRASWIADYPDPENYLALFYSENFAPGGPNVSHFSDSRVDQLYRQALAETSDTMRMEYYHEMERTMLDAAPIIPLYYDRSLRILQKGISGMQTNPMNHLSLKRVRKAPLLN